MRSSTRSRSHSAGTTRGTPPGDRACPDHASNVLTIDAIDPKSGTAEFKATAIRIDKLETAAGI